MLLWLLTQANTPQCTNSSQVGFIAQLKGKLTTQWYRYGTIFINHLSRLCYVYFMTVQFSAETLKAKQAYKQFASKHGIRIHHYHCDNGHFVDNAFKQQAKEQQHILTLNGIPERAIWGLKESTRKKLIHVRTRWQKCIHLALWPCAIRSALDFYNTNPSRCNFRGKKFSGVKAGFNMKHNHTFGGPVCTLNNVLAAGGKIPKWSPQSRLGINLGPSPCHACNVNLVLNLDTGLVSPQFHCWDDDFFKAISNNKTETTMSSN
ncbi:LOW QUALITY PROTEIN: hypothetical protein ACHAW6_008651 [Cyclotella cf. meneghiniana]